MLRPSSSNSVSSLSKRKSSRDKSSRPDSRSTDSSSRPESALSIHSMPELHHRPSTISRAATEDGTITTTSRRASLIDIATGTLASLSATTPPSTTPPRHRHFCFKFSLEFLSPSQPASLPPMRLTPPRLPASAQTFLQDHSAKLRLPASRRAVRVQPVGESAQRYARYAGRALAEWTLVVSECQAFFERRRGEGVPGDGEVETPTLGIEVFKKSGN